MPDLIITGDILPKQPVKQSRSSTGTAKQSKSVVKLDLEKYRNSKLYDGNTCKFGVIINGVDYIAKFAKTKVSVK